MLTTLQDLYNYSRFVRLFTDCFSHTLFMYYINDMFLKKQHKIVPFHLFSEIIFRLLHILIVFFHKF